MDDLRAQFPVLERIEYLNAGTTGPVPRRGYEAAVESLRRQLDEGRSGHEFFEHCIERIDLLRTRVAALMGADLGEIECESMRVPIPLIPGRSETTVVDVDAARLVRVHVSTLWLAGTSDPTIAARIVPQ